MLRNPQNFAESNAVARMNDPLPDSAVRLPQISSAPDHGLLMARDQKAEFFSARYGNGPKQTFRSI
jgi:hypothetical protein